MKPNINEKIKLKQEVVQTKNTTINQQLEELKNENEGLFLKITDILNAQCKQMRDNSNLKNILEQLSIKRAAYSAYKEKNNEVNLALKENEMLKELLDYFNNINKHSIKPFHIIAEDYELNINIERNNYFEIFGIRKIKISKIYEKLIELLSFYEFYIKENKIGCEKSKKESMNNKIESNINEKIKPKQKVVQTQNTAINQELEKLKNHNEGLFLKIKEFLNAQCKQMRDNSNLKNILEQLSIKRAAYSAYKEKNNEVNLALKENNMLIELLDCFNNINKHSIKPFHILAEDYELNINKEGDNYNKISEIYEKLSELVDLYKFKLKEINELPKENKINYERRKKGTFALETLMDAKHGFNNSKIVPKLIEEFKNELKSLFNNNTDNYLIEYVILENNLNSIGKMFEKGFPEIAKNFNFKNSVYAYAKFNNFVERFEFILNRAKNLIRNGKIKKGIFLRDKLQYAYQFPKRQAILERDYYLKNNVQEKEESKKINFKYYEKLLNAMACLFEYGNDEFYNKVVVLAYVVKNHDKLYEFTEEEIAIINEADRRIAEELKAFEKVKADIINFHSSLNKYLCYLTKNVFSKK